jgi:hypothetical protein
VSSRFTEDKLKLGEMVMLHKAPRAHVLEPRLLVSRFGLAKSQFPGLGSALPWTPVLSFSMHCTTKPAPQEMGRAACELTSLERNLKGAKPKLETRQVE